MRFLETFTLKNSTIMWIFSERDAIDTNPDYQRMGGIWTHEKRCLLIDSIINDYDLPKIYFHEYTREKAIRTGHKYAIIDGRQRLETIWQFMDDKLALSDDIELQRDPTIELGGLLYSDLGQRHPKLKIQFDSFVLPIIGVRTDDGDTEMIEEMFSRLNEAVPLNAAEKRNAIGGDFVLAIRRVAEHSFFRTRVRFGNTRYQFREVAARMLLTEFNLANHNRVLDTKKVWIDQIAKDLREDNTQAVVRTEAGVCAVLDKMMPVFQNRDQLLQAQGMMTIYYLVFRNAAEKGTVDNLDRQRFLEFKRAVSENRSVAEENYVEADFRLLEFDRLNQQGTNDASNILARVSILCDWLGLLDSDTS